MERKKEQRAQRKLARKLEKQRERRHRKIKNGLDLCAILTCFAAFLAAAVFKLREQGRGRRV